MDELTKMLNSNPDQQLKWAVSINTSDNRIEESWGDCFKRLGETKEFQDIELSHLGEYTDIASSICKKYGLYSEVGFSLAYDIAVQNGGVNSAAAKQIRTQITNEEKRLGRLLTEREKMIIIANAVADNSRRANEDVRTRKMSIVNQQGVVHGRKYDLLHQYDLRYDESWSPKSN